MNTGKPTMTRSLRVRMQKSEGQRGMRKTKDMSLTFSSPSLMVIMSSMSSPPISSMMDYTAWALPASVSPSIGTSCFHPSASPSMKKENFPIGSLTPLPMTPHTLPCTTIPIPRKIGESQLSSKGTMTRTLKLPPWSQSKGAWLLPSKQLKCNWTKANAACSAHTPTSGTNSSVPSMRDPTSTPSPGGSSPPSLATHTAVWLNTNQRVMSQGGFPGGQENHWGRRVSAFDPQDWWNGLDLGLVRYCLDYDST